METQADTSTDISLPGYYTFRKDRPKNRKAYTSSGGIAVLTKESLRSVCRFDTLSDSDIIWVWVLERLTAFTSDLYVAVVYIPPCNSSF